jgi:hypothetical protein
LPAMASHARNPRCVGEGVWDQTEEFRIENSQLEVILLKVESRD